MAESRSAIMRRFHEKVGTGRPLIGGGAGTGLSAKCEEAGGIDLIVIYNSGRFRMAGRGSLAGLMPYGNANAIVKEMAYEVLTAVDHTPVLAGVCATDPFMIAEVFLERAAAARLCRDPEFSDRRPDRWNVSPGTGRDGYGLRAGSRLHRPGPSARPAHHAVRL